MIERTSGTIEYEGRIIFKDSYMYDIKVLQKELPEVRAMTFKDGPQPPQVAVKIEYLNGTVVTVLLDDLPQNGVQAVAAIKRALKETTNLRPPAEDGGKVDVDALDEVERLFSEVKE